MPSLPNEEAIKRLVGAVLMEQSDEWAVQRSRYGEAMKSTNAGNHRSSMRRTSGQPACFQRRLTSSALPPTVRLASSYTTRWDVTTIARWVRKYAPLLEKNFRRTKRKPGDSWRLDETYIKIRGQWKYLYRAADTCGETIDFLLTAKRDTHAAFRFLKRASLQNGTPRASAIDGSAANRAGIEALCEQHGATIEIRQTKYLNNLVEQDHRRIKRKTRPMLGFKNFRSAAATVAGIELIHQLRKRQNKIQPDRPLYE